MAAVDDAVGAFGSLLKLTFDQFLDPTVRISEAPHIFGLQLLVTEKVARDGWADTFRRRVNQCRLQTLVHLRL